MEEDRGTWFHQQNLHWQASKLNCMKFGLGSGGQGSVPASKNPYPNMAAANASMPRSAVADLPQFKMGQANEPRGWFYCLPRHRQAVISNPNVISKEFLTSHYGYDGVGTPNSMLVSSQKRFLVFDQSGDQTSLFFSNPTGSRVQSPGYGNVKPFLYGDLCVGGMETNKEVMNQLEEPFSNARFGQNQESGEKSVMHEDTEELNALLYSDDDYSDEDEETSTGHSPSDMTGYNEKRKVEESEEEVASSAGSTKRKRSSEVDQYVSSSVMDIANSGKCNESIESKDDAESFCKEGGTQGEMGCLSANKRLRRERIWETVSILRNVIPGGEGKDALLVLDEAIQYLRTLKLKANILDVVL